MGLHLQNRRAESSTKFRLQSTGIGLGLDCHFYLVWKILGLPTTRSDAQHAPAILAGLKHRHADIRPPRHGHRGNIGLGLAQLPRLRLSTLDGLHRLRASESGNHRGQSARRVHRCTVGRSVYGRPSLAISRLRGPLASWTIYVYLNPSKWRTVPSLSTWKFWKIRHVFDPDGQLDSINCPSRSKTCRIFQNFPCRKWRDCPSFRWVQA